MLNFKLNSKVCLRPSPRWRTYSRSSTQVRNLVMTPNSVGFSNQHDLCWTVNKTLLSHPHTLTLTHTQITTNANCTYWNHIHACHRRAAKDKKSRARQRGSKTRINYDTNKRKVHILFYFFFACMGECDPLLHDPPSPNLPPFLPSPPLSSYPLFIRCLCSRTRNESTTSMATARATGIFQHKTFIPKYHPVLVVLVKKGSPVPTRESKSILIRNVFTNDVRDRFVLPYPCDLHSRCGGRSLHDFSPNL